MFKHAWLLLLACLYTGSSAWGPPTPDGRCGWQNNNATCSPISTDGTISGNLTQACCSINGWCGQTDTYCLVEYGCQWNCRNGTFRIPPSTKLSGSERIGIIIGVFGFLVIVFAILLWIVPWKTFQALRRPLDLFDLYGYPGLALFLFGTRTTWRTEAYVLGKVNDEDAMNFKKSVQDECTMVSVAAAIVSQISVTALSLNYLSQTHWIARGFLVFSTISSLMAVYYATTQQRTMGKLLQPVQIRGWIRGSLPPQRLSSGWSYKPTNNPRSDPEYYQPPRSGSTSITEDLMKSCFTPSVASVMTMSAPQMLLSASLFTLILGMGIYFGFIWTRDLDIYAQDGDSRNVMAMFLASAIICFMVYSLSGLIQDSDTSTERMLLLGYVKDYVEKNPGIAARWADWLREVSFQLTEK